MAQYTKHLPVALYRAEQVRELDRIAIEEKGILGFALMTRAAEATFEVIKNTLLNGPIQESAGITVFCGAGNNGGDGYVIASLAQQAGLAVRVVQVGDATKISGDALLACEQAIANGVAISPFCDQVIKGFSGDHSEIYDTGIIVDALLGTGLNGEVRGDFLRAIDVINGAGLPVCAVDIPSGLCADTGSLLGDAVNADVTVTYIGVKQGLLTGRGPEHCGALYFAGLDVPADVFESMNPSANRITRPYVNQVLGARDRGAHKGDYGHVVVIGGDHGMGGAVMMASEAASYVGAGMVTVLTREAHVAPLLARHPECMVLDADRHVSAINEILAKATVIVAGPGIGKGAWAVSLLLKALSTDVPLVLDADGLNFLASRSCSDSGSGSEETLCERGNWVLTPHPGEAARLLGVSTVDIGVDRFLSAQQISDRFNGIVALKGAGTLISQPVRLEQSGSQLTEAENLASVNIAPVNIALANVGNPGMATAGMGDVLSGVVGGLLAQGLSLIDAAQVGVWLHGKAADCAVKETGERGLRATDLLPFIRRLANGVQPLCTHGKGRSHNHGNR